MAQLKAAQRIKADAIPAGLEDWQEEILKLLKAQGNRAEVDMKRTHEEVMYVSAGTIRLNAENHNLLKLLMREGIGVNCSNGGLNRVTAKFYLM